MENQRRPTSLEFWAGKPATVAGMLLRDGSDDLAETERAEILAQLPSLDGMEILELGGGDWEIHLSFCSSG